MTLNGRSVEPGTKSWHTLPVTESLSLEVCVVRGTKPGKTLVVTAGVHGCEYVGVEAVRRLCASMQPETLCGAVVFVPLVNPTGVYAGAKQIVPEDGRNLNREFPGRADGTPAQRIAYAVEQQLYPLADFLLDLHGGDCNEEMSPLVFFPKAAGEEIYQTTRAAAQRLSVRHRVTSTAKDGLYSWATQCGIPALLLERGGAGRWTEREVEDDCQDVLRLMGYLGILPAQPVNDAQVEITQAVYETAPQDGLWYPAVQAGAPVAAGAVLGELCDLHGSVLCRVKAAFDGTLLYYTTALGVKAGDPLLAYGRPAE